MSANDLYDPPRNTPRPDYGSPRADVGSTRTDADGRTGALQAQIDDTVGIMRDNINMVSKRGEDLDQLQDKTDNLAISAQGFRRGANRVRKQMWWKDMKMRICIGVGIVILLLIIILPSVLATR